MNATCDNSLGDYLTLGGTFPSISYVLSLSFDYLAIKSKSKYSE